MRKVNLSELPQLSVNEQVPLVRGVLKSVFPQKTGTKKDGNPWRLQDLVIADSTGEAKVMVDDRDPIPTEWKGREVNIYCHEGDRGLTGLKVIEDEYRGKITRKLKLTGSGHIELLTGSASGFQSCSSNGDPGPQTTTPPAAATQQARPEPAATPPAQGQQAAPPTPQNGNGARPNGNGNGNGNSSSDKALAAIGARYSRVMDLAVYLQGQFEAKHQRNMSPEHFQAMVSTLFIEANRSGVFTQ